MALNGAAASNEKEAEEAEGGGKVVRRLALPAYSAALNEAFKLAFAAEEEVEAEEAEAEAEEADGPDEVMITRRCNSLICACNSSMVWCRARNCAVSCATRVWCSRSRLSTAAFIAPIFCCFWCSCSSNRLCDAKVADSLCSNSCVTRRAKTTQQQHTSTRMQNRAKAVRSTQTNKYKKIKKKRDESPHSQPSKLAHTDLKLLQPFMIGAELLVLQLAHSVGLAPPQPIQLLCRRRGGRAACTACSATAATSRSGGG
jgi:hypothetical protein